MEGYIEFYQVIWAESTAPLAEKVNEELKNKWIPIGGVSEAENKNGKILIQAMVKYRYPMEIA